MGREGVPRREDLKAGDEELAYGGAIRNTDQVNDAVEIMAAHDEALSETENSEVHELLGRYAKALEVHQTTTDPVQRETLQSEVNSIFQELVGRQQFANQVQREMDSALRRQDLVEQASDQALLNHPLGDKQGPENPDLPQARLYLEFYRVMMLMYDTTTESDRMVKDVAENSERSSIQRQLDSLIGKKLELLDSLRKYGNLMRHPEQLPETEWNDALASAKDIFEETLLFKRGLEEERSKKIKWVDIEQPSKPQ